MLGVPFDDLQVGQQDILGFSEAEGVELEQLENCLDGFHFGRTSEDVNSPVFALMNRELFFNYVIPEVIAFQEAIIEYAQQCDRATAGLTHGQPAEPTTIGKQLMNTVAAIDSILNRVFCHTTRLAHRLPYHSRSRLLALLATIATCDLPIQI